MKKSVYEIVTDKIISGLGKGQIPWKKKWVEQGLPMNYFSKRHYQGINMLLLALNDFESPYYLTFNQVNKLGGKVIKGSESEMVVFWKVYKKTQGRGSGNRRNQYQSGQEICSSILPCL